MDRATKAALLVVFCLMQMIAVAQVEVAPEPGSFMEQDGKIYVVVAVVVTIVVGIFLYLLNLERKLKKLEKRND